MSDKIMTEILQTLTAILDRLAAIEKQVNQIANPMAAITMEEKATLLGRAIASGDKQRIKAAKKLISESKTR
ncbi:MAG: hypothetical protein ACD_75C02623G0006 [uncultured bacterium]|nr:MAG: hypothetical protein ACD_75C02623G0006 [uncultured bacterium]